MLSWRFEPAGGGAQVSVPTRGCFAANNSEALREAAIGGLGLAVHYSFVTYVAAVIEVEVSGDGTLLVSKTLEAEKAALGIVDGMKLAGVHDATKTYLAYHRAHVFVDHKN